MFELFLGMLGKIVLKTAQSFVSKVVEHTADKALNDAKMIKDFEVMMKALHKNLKLLSAKADDIEKEINNAESLGRKKRKREVKEWLEEVKSFEEEVNELASEVESEGFLKRLMEGGKAGNLNQEIVKLIEQSRNFGELVLDVRGIKGEPFLTDRMVGEAFTKNCETILKLLETRLRIGVYGMGGVGKTTLARHIYNQLLRQFQGDVYWVTVSQDFTIKKLQDTIARFLGLDLSDEDDEDRRATILHNALSQKENSVLILDDVWEKIELSKVGCPYRVECCRLIVTTRSVEVCNQIHCQKIIQLEKLCEDEAWKLFNDTLGDEKEIDYGVEEIAKLVANLCCGLPLAIVTVAGAMRGETNIHTWKNALEELRERVAVEDGKGGDEVFKVLKYSFDRLNINSKKQSNEFNTLQRCFLYCSLYPEDYAIRTDDLVRKFISDGILDQRKRRAQINKGHSVLNKLVNVCLLECWDVDGQECVKMHDLVRGMALKIGDEKYMVRAGKQLMKIPDEEEWRNDLEKVSLMNNDIKRIEDGTSPDCPKLSILLLQNNSLEVIPDSFFTRLNGLRTLDLCWNRNIKKLPGSISDITSLEALLLEGCGNLEYVPYLGKLKALRELNLWNTGIDEVPAGVEELINLKFLAMCGHKLKILRRGLLLKLGHLQVLKLSINTVESIEGIENLRELEEYWGGLKNVNDFNCFIGSQSRDHDAPYRIRVGPSEGHFEFPASYACETELVFYGYNLKDEKVLGRDITLLVIEKCEGLSSCFVDDLKQLGNPTSLKSVRIRSCGGIECILSSEQRGSLPCDISNTLEILELSFQEDMKGVMIQKEEIGAASAAPAQSLFSSLRELRIAYCNNMMTVGLLASGRGSVSLPKLKRLSLSNLPRLRKVGLAAWGVPNLEFVDIWNCSELEKIFEDEGRGSVSIPKLKRLSLYDLPRLRKVGLAALGVPNLEEIKIHSCEEIEEIFEDEGRGSVSLPKLYWLSLNELPRLRKVGLAAWGVPNLKEIHISKCGEMEEIFEDEGRGSVSLPKLILLSLSDLPRLRKVGLAALGVPNLLIIHILSCSELEEILEDEGRNFISLSKLMELQLNNLPRLKSVCKATLICNSIEIIRIQKCEILMKKLPVHLQPIKMRMIRVEKEWWESLEWDNPNLPSLLQPFLEFCEEIEEDFEE